MLTEINTWVLSESIPEGKYGALCTKLGFDQREAASLKHSIKHFPEVTFNALLSWIHDEKSKSPGTPDLDAKLVDVLKSLGLWRDELFLAGLSILMM